MNTFRRSVNIIAGLLLGVVVVCFAAFLQGGTPRRPVPLSFIVVFAALPAIAHVVAAVLAWQKDSTSLRANTAVVGLLCASIPGFVWATMITTFVEYQLMSSIFGHWWQAVGLIGAASTLPLASALNFLFFRRALVFQPLSVSHVGL